MAGKIMILSVPESDGDVFDRIISVLQPLGISEVSEITPKSSIQIGELHIDSSGHSIKKGKKEINLTNTEFQMLYFWQCIREWLCQKNKFMNMYGMANIFLMIAILHHISDVYE